jgi:hypothetical protein
MANGRPHPEHPVLSILSSKPRRAIEGQTPIRESEAALQAARQGGQYRDTAELIFYPEG